MSPREKVLSAVLGTFILAAVAGFGGYVGIYLPMQTRAANADNVERETREKRERLDQLRKDLSRLPAAKAKSLPADPEVARHEYEAALSKLLRDAKVPRGYTVRPKAPDGRAVPELAPKKPAYNRLAFEITLKAVDLGTLTDLLERYYRLGLLHQITKFQVKRADPAGTAAARRGSLADRADLDVTLVTEAVMLDGVEPRRTLRPVPVATGAVLGSVGFHHLTQTPEIARGLAVPPGEPVLASAKRDYLAVLGRDPFHGPLPPPPAPVQVARTPEFVEPPEPPKEDVSPFIKLTGITRRSDGTAQADIKDAANNLDYQIDFTLKDGGLSPKVVKFYFLRGKRKTLDGGADLAISDDTSGTARKFRVVGIDADGIVLIEGVAAEKPKDDGRGGRGGRGRPAVTLPPAHPAASVVGGPAAGLPQDRVYVWRVGQPLKAVKELQGDEGLKAVERARGGWETVPATMHAAPAAGS